MRWMENPALAAAIYCSVQLPLVFLTSSLSLAGFSFQLLVHVMPCFT